MHKHFISANKLPQRCKELRCTAVLSHGRTTLTYLGKKKMLCDHRGIEPLIYLKLKPMDPQSQLIPLQQSVCGRREFRYSHIYCRVTRDGQLNAPEPEQMVSNKRQANDRHSADRPCKDEVVASISLHVEPHGHEYLRFARSEQPRVHALGTVLISSHDSRICGWAGRHLLCTAARRRLLFAHLGRARPCPAQVASADPCARELLDHEKFSTVPVVAVVVLHIVVSAGGNLAGAVRLEREIT
jgi:hypothetical protein